MTVSNTKSSENEKTQFDITPLSWVIGELRETLSHAGNLLNNAISQDAEAQATTLLQAKTHLHQAHGALQIVEVEGVSIVTETVEELIERIQSGKLILSSDVTLKITTAFHAVLHYLEDLVSGVPPQPVRLYPEYRELLELKDAERIHPADLFFPSLSVQEKIPELSLSANVKIVDYSVLRLKFEKLLLTVLTSKDAKLQSTAAKNMGDLIQEIVEAQNTSQHKAFWLVMRAFSESAAEMILKDERHVKQIWGRINLQIRRLVDGNSSIPERLLRDSLFFIAQVENVTPFVAQIKKAYQLENNIPKDFDQKKYSAFSPADLTSTKEQLSHVKNLWGRISNGDSSLAEKFSQKINDLASFGSKLQSPALSHLFSTFQEIADQLVAVKDKERIGIEFATALLFVDNALDQITHLPSNFATRTDEIINRLKAVIAGVGPENQESWMGDISREAQQKETIDVLVQEMQASLKLAEKGLDDFFREPVNVEVLAPVDKILSQIGGALAILDQEEARAAVEFSRNLVVKFADRDSELDQNNIEEDYKKVAQNVGALSFFLEALQSQPDIIKNRFSFDAEQGLFLTNLVSTSQEKELLPYEQLITEQTEKNAITAEEELVEQQKESDRLLVSLVEKPDDSAIKEQLKNSLDNERSFAALLDDTNASSRANKAIDLLGHSDLTTSPNALNDIVAATAKVEQNNNSSQDVILPESEEAIDAELLEIFLMEADEVLEAVGENIPLSKSDPSNQEYLIRLRRSFHTLKGSGRMVGLMEFGEGAWSVEQLMNFWLSESKSGNETLYSLLEFVSEEMHVWVEELKNTSTSTKNSQRITNAANQVRDGHGFTKEIDTSIAETKIDAEVKEQEVVDLAEVAEAIQTVDHSPIHLDTVSANEDNLLPTLDIGANLPSLELSEENIELFVSSEFAESIESVDATEVDELVEPSVSVIEVVQVVDEQALDFPIFEAQVLADPAVEIDAGNKEENLFDTETIELSALEGDFEGDFAEELMPEAVEHNVNVVLDLTSETDAVKTAKIIDFPDLTTSLTSEDDTVKKIGDFEISLALHTIYMAETDEIVRFLSREFSEWRHEASRPVLRHAVHATHSLAGSSATVGLFPVQELAHAMENVLQRLERHPVVLEQSEFDLLEEVVVIVKQMLHKFGASQLADPAPQTIQKLNQLLDVIIARSQSGEIEEFVTSTNELVDPTLLGLDGDALTLNDSVVTDEQILSSGPEQIINTINAVDVFDAQQLVDTIEVDEIVEEIETIEETEALETLGANEFVDSKLTEAVQSIEAVEVPSVFEDQIIPTPVIFTPEPPIAVVENFESEQSLQADEPESSEIKISDEIDMDLLPVFIEEGNDLLPMVGQLLRSWQQAPEDNAIPQSILRLMHTIKGSARMAGAMKLGQHTHDMETRIENLMHTGSAIRQPLMDDLMSRQDYAMQLFERLQNPNAEVGQLPELSASVESVDAADSVNVQQSPLQKTELNQVVNDQKSASLAPKFIPSTAKANAAPLPSTNVNTAASPLVRVRADILDRLVNQAGEVSISRSKLENEVDTLRSSLSELTDNVSRLRDQLREVEIQAETQITSRMALSGDREFDPLEFDRFTRLQELTRMMAESVNDVATVQTTLGRTIEGASNDLHTQGRLTRELQQDLMRVRMIPFSSVSERLYRIARQTSKELDKRVNLDIRGTSVEIDRSVLEKMTAPFEHMLRNAIVHGIESKQTRVANGKSEVGELLIEIRQEGNEVVIHFTDDGQGLNLQRIRAKAEVVGLLTNETPMSENEIVNLIFESGFSTASEVTEIAGRGVGMDVVRSEALALGGRVSVDSVEGKGAHFTIHLPLTLAVTQVVILSAGGKVFAVPSVLVEQVQQLKSAALASAYNEGSILFQGSRVHLHYLPTMLGEHDAVPENQQYTPVLIMKSDNERVAIHVDQIVGNREVVVKNIGPQLSRMIGIAGATVMGSGNIVLILNPVPLAQKIEHERARLTDADLLKAGQNLGAVAELTVTDSASTASVSVKSLQGLRKQNVVMVVDDSLTVRRVTQRLLVREGYQVVLAKDGIDALEQLQSITPDVMLLDIEMPRMDGFDLARNMRADSRTQNIPIIMITSRTADKHRNYAKELGVNEYFGKPYRETELLAAISSFVNKEVDVE